jgi:ankyrin repeat protein
MHLEFAETLLSFANAKSYLSPKGSCLKREPLHEAALNGDADMMRLLVQWGARGDVVVSDPPSCLGTNLGNSILPIHLAAISPASLNAIKVLHQSGSNICATDQYGGYTAMHWALEHCPVDGNNIPTLQYLEDHGLSLNAIGIRDRRPIHIAAERGLLEVVRWLKESGAKVTSVYDAEGRLPVHLASMKGHLGVIQYLRDSGKPVFGTDVRDREKGNLPLHFAAQYGQIDVVRYLIEQGESVNAKNSWGDTPLHLAAKGGESELVKVLNSLGADHSATNGFWRTPLHVAARKGKLLAARELKYMGANLAATDIRGRTPSKWAKVKEFAELAEELTPPRGSGKRCIHHFGHNLLITGDSSS